MDGVDHVAELRRTKGFVGEGVGKPLTVEILLTPPSELAYIFGCLTRLCLIWDWLLPKGSPSYLFIFTHRLTQKEAAHA